MAGFDEQCPHCDAKIDIVAKWDYQTSFNCECDACGKLVHVDVNMEPIFETSIPMCGKCCKNEITRSWHYCQKCQEELEALSKFNEAKMNKGE